MADIVDPFEQQAPATSGIVDPFDTTASQPAAPKSFGDRLSNMWEKATPGGPLWMVREATRSMQGAVEGAKATVAPHVGTEEEEYNRRALEEAAPGQSFRAAQFMSPSAPGGGYVSRVGASLEGRPIEATRPPVEPPPPAQPPPLPPEVSEIPRQIERPNVGVGLLHPEVPHELPATSSRALSAAGTGGPLSDVSPETLAHMRAVMEEQGFTPHTIDQRLEEMSAHHFLGEITPSLEADMGAIAAPPGPGKLEVMNSIRQRALEAPQRVRSAFDRAFGGNENVAQLRQIMEGDRAQASAPFYETFRNTVIPPTPQLDRLMPRLRASGALQAANRALEVEGQPATHGFIDEGVPAARAFDEDVNVTRVPTATAFQYAKEFLDSKIEAALAAPGGANEARRFTQLKNDLVHAIDNHPDPNVAGIWQQARTTYARPTEILDAIRVGQRVLTEHTHADDLPFLTATYSPEQMNAMRIGMRSTLENVLNKRDTLTAEIINKVLSPNNIDKIRWAIGDQATDGLVSAIEHERHMHTAPTRVHGGSPTALRLEAQKRWTPQPGALSNVTVGDVAGAVTSPVKTGIKVAEHFGLSARRAKKEAQFTRLREEAARLMTLQGPERDAVARYLVGGENNNSAIDLAARRLQMRRPGFARGGAVHNHNPTEPQKKAGNSLPSEELTSSGNVAVPKSSTNDALRDIKFFGNIPDAKILLIEGFNGLDRDRQHVVLSHVRAALYNHQITDVIIEAIPVNVMDVLIGGKRSTYSVLNDPAMLAHRLSISRDIPIPKPIGGFIDALASIFKGTLAGRSAKKTSLSASGSKIPSEGSAAARADEKGRLIQKILHNGREVETHINPTIAQSKAGNYLKGTLNFQGVPISLENPKGSIRSGIGRNGKRWSVTMPADYGYLKRTEGADGDHVDCYLGPNDKSDQVFVVDQKDADTGRFDEHKCLLGFSSEKEALKTYRAGFSDGKDRVKHVKRMTISEFRDWLERGDTSKPIKVALRLAYEEKRQRHEA